MITSGPLSAGKADASLGPNENNVAGLFHAVDFRLDVTRSGFSPMRR